jgi:regulator of protease activity HflC (stomatin/prohibitin superfamily)
MHSVVSTQRRSFLTVVDAWERGVRLSFGKYTKTLEPGLRLCIPIYHQVITVNVAERVKSLPKQALISKDNISYTIESSVQYKVTDPVKAVLNVEQCDSMILDKCQMVLRQLLTDLDIKDVLHHPPSTADICKDKWGVSVISLKLTEINFDESLKRAMSVKAEVDRNAEAKMINALAELNTAEIYLKAAKLYQNDPIALKLSEHQLLHHISKNPASTVVIVPSDCFTNLAGVNKIANMSNVELGSAIVEKIHLNF